MYIDRDDVTEIAAPAVNVNSFSVHQAHQHCGNMGEDLTRKTTAANATQGLNVVNCFELMRCPI